MVPLGGSPKPDPIVNVFANRIAQGLATSYARNELVKFAKMAAAQYRIWQRHQQQAEQPQPPPNIDPFSAYPPIQPSLLTGYQPYAPTQNSYSSSSTAWPGAMPYTGPQPIRPNIHLVKPQPIIPQPIIPQPIIPQPVIPQPVIPQPVIPQPVIPQPVIPQPVIPCLLYTSPSPRD